MHLSFSCTVSSDRRRTTGALVSEDSEKCLQERPLANRKSHHRALARDLKTPVYAVVSHRCLQKEDVDAINGTVGPTQSR